MEEGEYKFPEVIELDEEAFEDFEGELRNPRPPNDGLKALLAVSARSRSEALARAEERAYETGVLKLPRKYGLYDVVMVALFLMALAALVVSLAACGGGQKCWNAQSPTGGSPGSEKSCRQQQ